MGELTVGPEDPAAADVRALIEAHLAFARAHSRPEDVHALEATDLVGPKVSFFGVRDGGGALVAIGALKELDHLHAEIKSMHTAEAARRQGAGRVMVDHLLTLARQRGYRRVSLETGSAAPFAPARALYESVGFRPCGPFAGYGPSAASVFMTLALDE